MSVRVYGKFYPLVSFLMSVDEDIFVPVRHNNRTTDKDYNGLQKIQTNQNQNFLTSER